VRQQALWIVEEACPELLEPPVQSRRMPVPETPVGTRQKPKIQIKMVCGYYWAGNLLQSHLELG